MGAEFSGILGSHRNMVVTNAKSSSTATVMYPNFYFLKGMYINHSTYIFEKNILPLVKY
jgi:hypothetical protein